MQKRISAALFSITVPLMLSLGCAVPSSIPLTQANKDSINAVQIDKNVPKPKGIFYRGTAQAWGGALGGAIGAAATAGASKDEATLMVEFMDKEHIDISEIVYSEAEKQIKEQHVFKVIDATTNDATLLFSVDMYGFNKTHPFGSNMNPVIRVSAKLTKASGETIWQESEYVSDFASENNQGQSLEIYKNEPLKLKAALTCAAQVAVKRIIAKLL